MKPFREITPLRIIAALWIFTLLVSCSLSPAQVNEENEPLLVEFTDWWGDYTIIIAQEKGMFEKNGVKVQPVYYENFSVALPDLASGQIDGGLLAIGDAINVAKHTDVRVVGVYDNGSFNTIVSVPEIGQVGGLKDKRVGVPVGTSYELLISEVLTSAGLKMSDVILVNIAPENVPASLGKTIDAGFIYEPYTSEAITRGNNLLVKSTEFIGLYPDVIVFRNAVVRERGDEIRGFLKAWFEAVEYRKQYPAESHQIIADYFNTSIDQITSDDALEILSLEDNYEIFKPEVTVKRSIYRTARLNADFLVRMGVLSSQPNLEMLLTPAYLP
ncbi:MAG: ABC transporter substrate-binding protein [Anaerolineales bacterium]